tara:strand:+ start:334 stop:1383 length:1050 start_codon:yes stop_codon:yes gene_type:complete
MNNFKNHLISLNSSIKNALLLLDKLSKDSTLFVIDNKNKLKGSLTDGDIRRGLMKGISVDDELENVINKSPKFILKNDKNLKDIIYHRDNDIKILPVLNSNNVIVDILNFRIKRSYLPIDVAIMAGGKGERLKPLTDKIPKPLLKIGNKPIIEYSIDRLTYFGINEFWISINYLGEKIESYFGSGKEKGVKINYLTEDVPLGTIGAISKIKKLKNPYLLLTNSDVLTNINYENFYLDFIDKNADLSIASIPYDVKVPYAVIQTNEGSVVSLDEKPTYTYYSNGGIYLMKKNILKYIPKNKFFNATDLIELLIKKNKKITSFPILDYWLDIGKPDDFKKAKKDILKYDFK